MCRLPESGEAWASLKSFSRTDVAVGQPPDDPGGPTVKFHSNAAPI
jgi:hypothetical protein